MTRAQHASRNVARASRLIHRSAMDGAVLEDDPSPRREALVEGISRQMVHP
jgi:hypothetical protein